VLLIPKKKKKETDPAFEDFTFSGTGPKQAWRLLICILGAP
jgi:hypothetical protein